MPRLSSCRRCWHVDHAGHVTLAGDADGPSFDRRRRGWDWTISGPGNVLRSRSLDEADLDPPDISGRPSPPPPPAPPKVAMRASLQGRAVILTVEDDGPGLSPEQMAKAMQAGQRLDESAPGIGFGLSITRELAELYSGSLSLDRSALCGLRVSLRLPRGDIDADAPSGRTQ